MEIKGSRLLKRAYLEMQHTNPDLKFAFNLLNKSANKKNHEALYAIASWYLHGRFVKKNPTIAVQYLLKSIEGNYGPAFYDLAVCYERGIGAKKNLKKAFECYLNAALYGDKQSFYEVGRCYYYGIGVIKNNNISNIWFKHENS